MNSYGAYRNVRDAAWNCLIDFHVDSLPIDLVSIAQKAGVKLLKNSEVRELSGSESGVCIFDGGEWFLIFDDECSIGRRRFTVAHELGHIFMGHELIGGQLGRTFDRHKAQSEKEADMFAARLLAPACVLWGLDLHSAEDIADTCGVSIAAARVRAERMEVLRKRGKFLTSPLERKVHEQFAEFIATMKNSPT